MSNLSAEDFTRHLYRFFQRSGDGKDQSAPAIRLNAGDPCPACAEGLFEYDGMLNLTCTHCHQIASSSGGSCT